MIEFKSGFMINPAGDRELFRQHTQKMMGLEEKRRIENIAVNRISLRQENKFITKKEALKPLIKSIRDNGLIEPILVCPIGDYLIANKCIIKDSFASLNDVIENGKKVQNRMIDYLTANNLEKCDFVPDEVLDPMTDAVKKEKISKATEPLVTQKTVADLKNSLATLSEYEALYNDGFSYFITAGHRRFKAYLSILLDEPVVTDSDWKRVYEEKLKNASKELQDSKWFNIPAYTLTSADITSKSETTMYSDSNTTQRELTSFEVVVNALDEMKLNGDWERICRETVDEVVDGLSERGTYNLVLKLKKMDEYKDQLEEVGKDEEKIKSILKSLPIELVPKTENVLNNKLSQYIDSKKKREINPETIKQSRRICSSFDSKYMQLIFDEKITLKDAKDLVPVINNASQEEKNDIFEQINSGKYDFTKKIPRGTKKVKPQKTAEKADISSLVKISNKVTSADKAELTNEDLETLKAVISKLTEYIA